MPRGKPSRITHERVYAYLVVHGECTQRQLADALECTKAVVVDRLLKLADDGLVYKRHDGQRVWVYGALEIEPTEQPRINNSLLLRLPWTPGGLSVLGGA